MYITKRTTKKKAQTDLLWPNILNDFIKLRKILAVIDDIICNR